MSDDLDIFDMERVEQDDLLNELDSLKGLLGDDATNAPQAAASGGGDGERGSETQDEVPDLDIDPTEQGEEPTPANPDMARGSADEDETIIPELGEELVVPEPAAQDSADPDLTAEAPAQMPAQTATSDPADDGDIPVLSDVVFSGSEVPDEAVALMSALNAGTEAAEPAEEPAPQALPSAEEMEKMVDEALERELKRLRGELRERILSEVRARLGLDSLPSDD